MTKHIELKRFNQGTALTTGTLALPPLVIEGLAEFNGSFDRLCLKAGIAAIEAMLAAMRHSFVASATNGTRSGRAIDGARSVSRSAGTVARRRSAARGRPAAPTPRAATRPPPRRAG
jgi:hypothetical protein